MDVSIYVYNVSFHIEKLREKEWLLWVEKELVNKFFDFGFEDIKLMKMNIEHDELVSYCVHLETNRKEVMEKFSEEEHILKNEMYNSFGQSALSFSTELEVVKKFGRNG